MSQPDARTAAELRLVELPAKHLPEYVSSAAMDPDTLRIAAEAYAASHAASGEFTVKPWVVLYLLDVWEAAKECADWHDTQRGNRHVTDVKLKEAVYGDR